MRPARKDLSFCFFRLRMMVFLLAMMLLYQTAAERDSLLLLSLIHTFHCFRFRNFSPTLAIMPNPYVNRTTSGILSSIKVVQVTMSKVRSSLYTLVVEESFLLFGVTVIKLCQCWVPTQVDVTREGCVALHYFALFLLFC